jgi:hypothetical protein
MKRIFIMPTVSLMVIGLAMSFTGCQSGGADTSQPEPTPVPSPAIMIFPIEGDASMDKEAYLPGEDVVIELSFENLTDEVFQLEPFPPQIEIKRRYPYDETARTFSAGTDSRSLEPGETVSYTLTWDRRDNQGEPVPYGYYYLEFGRARRGGDWIAIGRHRYISLLILPEEGVIEQTIEVNESKTVNDITITLERVELTATEAKFYALNTPLGYEPPQGSNLPPPPLMSLRAEAGYSLDGGQTIEAGLSGIRFLEDGMGHTWDRLDPVPKGTKGLTFTVTKLGDWEGPWEFRVSLE